MKRIAAILLLASFLTACAPAAAPEPTATETPAETATHTPWPTRQPTETGQPTKTPTVTRTKIPTHTPVPTKAESLDELQEEFYAVTIRLIEENVIAVERVNMIRADSGTLKIEVSADYSSPDILRSANYDIMAILAAGLGELPESQIAGICGGSSFAIDLTLLADNGKKYKTLTPYSLLKKVNSRAVTQEEWETAAGYSIE